MKPNFNKIKILFLIIMTGVFSQSFADTAGKDNLKMLDVFELEMAIDPQFSPDGKAIVYVRNFMDIMADKRRSNLWIMAADGSHQRPLTSGMVNDHSPRFSTDGKRLAYISNRNGAAQIFIRWLDSDRELQVAQLRFGAGSLAWSRDGKWLAFSHFVPATVKPLAQMPSAPEGANWAQPAKVIDQALYRTDGGGYLKAGYMQLFVVSSEGGTPRQITHGNFNHQSNISWMPDNRSLVFSANRQPDWQLNIAEAEIFRIDIHSSKLTQLSHRVGPDVNPQVAPDGKHIAYLGFDDKQQGYQITRLYVMDADGSNSRSITDTLDRDVAGPVWSANSKTIYFQYDDHGDTKIARTSLAGKRSLLASHLGGTTLGRPYGGGSFSIGPKGNIAYTWTSTKSPAEIAIVSRSGKKPKVVTELNADLLNFRELGPVEEISATSSYDQLELQGWLVKPPHFDPAKKYPLILEIHGGPFANYGSRFSAEIQLYAAAGYMVLYSNPRGSTSYGEKFGNLIHHAYPGNDYDDLMSLVDKVIAGGHVDTKQLFVTGGSGGGVLTSWIVGKTGRFAAAVVAKPVINWASFVLTADMSPYFVKYWFEKMPWEDYQSYWERSPLSLVGNVTTPTMLLTGESDYRTPISETEQFYQALKLRGIDTVMVRIPEASHHLTTRPSNLIAKVSQILAWFEKYKTSDDKG